MLEITLYHENYSGFVKEKENRLLEEFQAYQEQQKKIKQMKEAIKRLREWANQANPPHKGLHKRARNMERALERMEKVKRPILERKKMGLEFEAADRSGKDVISVKKAQRPLGENGFSVMQACTFNTGNEQQLSAITAQGCPLS